ncbi:hypothetical protein [Terrimonas alba]|uniref:hypothetical protein n=1 Tax=Terrimonas alba TaxID=3349636 RepID=UPI0035F39F01
MNSQNIELLKDDFELLLQRRANGETLKPLKNVIFNFTIQIGGNVMSDRRQSSLRFEFCLFKADVTVLGRDMAGFVSFANCIFNKDVKSIVENTSFKDCSFNGSYLMEIDRKNDFTLDDISVRNKIELSGNAVQVRIQNVNLGQNKEAQLLYLDKLSCQRLIIENVVFEKIDVGRSSVTNWISLNKITANKLIMSGVVVNGLLKFEESNVDNLSLMNIKGDSPKLKIDGSNKFNAFHLPLSSFRVAQIFDCEIAVLELSDTNIKDSFVNIKGVKTKSLMFRNVYNEGVLTISEMKMASDGVVSIISSNLGKTDFIYCDFSKAVMRFENSKLTEIFLSETNFPKQVKVGNNVNHSQAQLAFGQLATAYQKQGDTIRALEYSAREIEAHYYETDWHFSQIFNKINLWLNLVSNNFGRSWIQGVLFSFSVGILFYCALLISTDEYHFYIPNIDTTLIPSFLKFMNPIRFFELETLFAKQISLTLNSWSYIWDFLGRVFVAYGFYQTIQAFRRFGRR